MPNISLYEYKDSGGKVDSATFTQTGSKNYLDTNSIISSISYSGDNLGIDASTNAIVTISNEHHEIHEGDHYFIGSFQTLAAGGSVVFAVTTPNTSKWAHMLFSVDGTNQLELNISYLGSITGGTALVPMNNNLNSANTSSLTIVRDPTVTGVGSYIFMSSSGSAISSPVTPPKSGVFTRSNEIILKQNSTHLFYIISRGNGNIVSYVGEWYEHTDIN